MAQIVQHHIKYKEIHGEDEIKLMTMSDHKKLHIRLRNEKRCNISPDHLRKISIKAYHRSPKYKKTNTYSKCKVNRLEWLKTQNRLVFAINTVIGINLCFHESLRYNQNTGHVSYVAYFTANHRKKLYEVII